MADNARIVDRGYTHYEGERGGLGEAIRSTALHGMQRVLGIRRPVWSKVLPVVSIGIAFVPAIVFVGMSVFIEDDLIAENLVPSYAEYYGFVTAAIIIFAAFVAPEVLCTDRRTGMLGLYLASPLNRDTYLVAKTMSVLAVLSIVTVGPLLLMFAVFVLEGSGPSWPSDGFVLLLRIVAGGLAVSSLHAALSLMVSSFTSRRAVASAAIIVTLLFSAAVVSALVEEADVSPNLYVLDLFGLPFLFVTHIYGETSDDPTRDQVSTSVVAAANIGWTVLFALVTRFRYQRLRVTK